MSPAAQALPERWWDTATELCALLHAAGFAKLELHGGYDRRPVTVDSPQLVVRAS